MIDKDLDDYIIGKPLGIAFQWNGLINVIRNQAILFTPRPFVLPERQTLLVTLISGATSLRSVFLPLEAILIIPAGFLIS